MTFSPRMNRHGSPPREGAMRRGNCGGDPTGPGCRYAPVLPSPPIWIGVQGGQRLIKPPERYGFEGSQAEGRVTVTETGVPTAVRSPAGTGPVEWSKETVPPENDA